MRVDLELRMGVIKMQTKTFLSSLKDLHIWQGLSLLAFVVLGMGCAQVRYAQTDLEQAIDNPVTKTFPWGEVYCGRGTVCAEVEVLRVDIEPNDGGAVEVTLHNRTAHQAAVQIALEIKDADGVRLDQTPYENIGVEPRGEAVWRFPGVYQENAQVRVLLRAREQG